MWCVLFLPFSCLKEMEVKVMLESSLPRVILVYLAFLCEKNVRNFYIYAL